MAGDEHELLVRNREGEELADLQLSQLRGTSNSNPLHMLKFHNYTRGESTGYARWGSGEKVMRELQEWLDEEMTRRNIQIENDCDEEQRESEEDDRRWEQDEIRLIVNWMKEQKKTHGDDVVFVFKTTYDY